MLEIVEKKLEEKQLEKKEEMETGRCTSIYSASTVYSLRLCTYSVESRAIVGSSGDDHHPPVPLLVNSANCQRGPLTQRRPLPPQRQGHDKDLRAASTTLKARSGFA